MVVWGGRKVLYRLEDSGSRWVQMAAVPIEYGGRLAQCGGMLMVVGGQARVYAINNFVSSWDGERWTYLKDMVLGCVNHCVVSDGEGGLVVMGGCSYDGKDGSVRILGDIVQVRDGGTSHTWSVGHPLPQACSKVSAAVHNGTVFVMGGLKMGCSVWSAQISDLVRVQNTLIHFHPPLECMGLDCTMP